MKTLTLLLLTIPAYAQTTAGVMTSPLFVATDQNGTIIPGGKLCAYSAGTTNAKDTFADAGGMTPNTNPVIMNSSGRATIYGEGSYKLVLLQPGSTSDCTTGATVWTVDNVFILTASPSFATVTATTFNSTATGATNAVQQYLGTFAITGAGNASFQSVTATSTFNSLATGSTSAFQTNTGTFTITGAGNAAFQSVASNYSSLVGQSADVTAPGAGFAFLEYNSTSGVLKYNLGGAGWVTVPSVPGSNTQVVFNNSGALGASSHLTFSGDNLTLGGASNTGVISPLFNSTNTGTNNAFQTNTGTFFVKGNGNLGAQSVTVNNTSGTMGLLTGVSSNTDTTGIVTLSGGTFTLVWPSGHTYTSNPTCFANDFSGVHAVSTGASTTQLVINGTGSDQVQYFCMGGIF